MKEGTKYGVILSVMAIIIAIAFGTIAYIGLNDAPTDAMEENKTTDSYIQKKVIPGDNMMCYIYHYDKPAEEEEVTMSCVPLNQTGIEEPQIQGNQA